MKEKALPNNRLAIDFDAYWRPTFWQRLQILIGFAVVTTSKVFVDRKNEQVRAGTSFGLSDKLTARDEAGNHAVDPTTTHERPTKKNPALA